MEAARSTGGDRDLGVAFLMHPGSQSLSRGEAYPRRKAFPLEHAWEWVVGSEPTGSEGLRGVML